MKFIVTAEQMRAAEQNAINSGVSGEELTVLAGKSIFNVISDIFASKKISLQNKNFVILCGRGGNGADGIAVSKHIIDAGGISLCLFVEDLPNTDTARAIYTRYITNENVPYGLYLHNEEASKEALKNCDVIIDCVYGFGFRDVLPLKIADVFRYINASSDSIKISVDVPSGVDCDTGVISEAAFHPDYTIVISAMKKGFTNFPAYDFCGEIFIADIGIRPEMYPSFTAVVTDDSIRRFIPHRRKSSHKGSFGRLLNIAGCERYMGAAMLSTRSALRCGVGIAVLASTKEVCRVAANYIPEAVFCGMKSDVSGFLNEPNLESISDLLKVSTAVSIGCGIGVTPATLETVKQTIKKASGTIIIDADGLNCLVGNINILKDLDKPIIITPHPTEFARLLNISVQSLQSLRIEYAAKFAIDYNVIVLLKGPCTIIAAPDGRIGVNMTGNTALAKAGSGDVLTGMIAAFAAGGVPPYEAALLGAYLHGRAAEKLTLQYSATCVLASDIIEKLPEVF